MTEPLFPVDSGLNVPSKKVSLPNEGPPLWKKAAGFGILASILGSQVGCAALENQINAQTTPTAATESTPLPNNQSNIEITKYKFDSAHPEQPIPAELLKKAEEFNQAAQGQLVFAGIENGQISSIIGSLKNAIAKTFQIQESAVSQDLIDRLTIVDPSSVIEIKFDNKPFYIKTLRLPTTEGVDKFMFFANFDGQWRQLLLARGDKGLNISSGNEGVVVAGLTNLVAASDADQPVFFNALLTVNDPDRPSPFNQALYPVQNSDGSLSLVLRDQDNAYSGLLPSGLFQLNSTTPGPSPEYGVFLNASFQPEILPTPTSQSAPVPEVTPTPEVSPTPAVPMLEGLSVQVPDPRISNPELFDLTNKDAPITQFVNTMQMAGIEVTGEQVAQGITFTDKKTDGTPLVDKDGNPFVVGVYNLDPDPTKTGETLEGPIPLAIAQKNEKGEWGWYKTTTKLLSNFLSFPFGGTIDSRSNQQMKYPQLFTAGNLSYDLEWIYIEPKQGKVSFSNPAKYALADEKIKFAEKNGLDKIMTRLFYPLTYPEWLSKGNFTKEQFVQIAIKHVHDVLDSYGEKIDYIDLATEYFPQSWNIRPDILKDRVGYNEFITTIAKEVQKTAPNALIIINEDHNEIVGVPDYQNTLNLVKLLKSAGINNLAVGMEMHINGARPPTKEQVVKAMKSFGGIPVIVTEMDVNIKNLKGTDRLVKQAKIYKDIMDACLESGVCRAFFVFQIGDQYSWLENGGYNGSPNSDATILDDDLNPKPSYYAILQSLYQQLSKLNFQ